MNLKEVIPFHTSIYETTYNVDISCYDVISRMKRDQPTSLVNSNRGGWHSKILGTEKLGFL